MLIPSEIDASGSTDVSAALNAFFKSLPPDSEVAVEGTYCVNGGVTVRNVQGLRLVGEGKFVRTAPSTNRYGAQNLKFVGGRDVRIDGVTLEGWNTKAVYDASVEDEMLLALHGVSRVTIQDATFVNSPADFVYVSHRKTLLGKVPCESVVLHGCSGRTAGRQGIVLNGVNGFLLAGSTFKNVARWMFDCEPFGGSQVKNVWIASNTLGHGNGGFFHFAAPVNVDTFNLRIEDNLILGGQPTVWLEPPTSACVRSGFTMRGNAAEATNPAKSAIVRASNWRDVSVTDNTAYVTYDPANAVKAIAGSVIGPNNFIRV